MLAKRASASLPWTVPPDMRNVLAAADSSDCHRCAYLDDFMVEQGLYDEAKGLAAKKTARQFCRTVPS
ncbi:MAG: hypothetical protein FWB78_12775 [Treponema sp.]|nr:hypothetical protein [Treponema sp.]